MISELSQEYKGVNLEKVRNGEISTFLLCDSNAIKFYCSRRYSLSDCGRSHFIPRPPNAQTLTFSKRDASTSGLSTS